MIFRPEMVELIFAGEKTETRRPVSDNPRSPWWIEECGLRSFNEYAVSPGRGKRAVAAIRFLGARQEPLSWIDDDGARAEGFPNRKAFVDYWRELYGKWDLALRVWVVRFELAEQAA